MAGINKNDKSYYRLFEASAYDSIVIHELYQNSYIHFYIYNPFATISSFTPSIVECFACLDLSGKANFYYRIQGYPHAFDDRKFAIGYYVSQNKMYIITPISYNHTREFVIYSKGTLDVCYSLDNSIETTKFLSGSNF